MTTPFGGDTRIVTIKPTVDAGAVRPGVSEVKREVGSMADDIRAKGKRAAEGLAGIGEGAKQGAAEAARALASTQREFQKLEAELLSGSRRGTAAYQLELAKLKGVSDEALGPLAARYNAIQEAQRRATVGQQQLGVSAAQTANALRQVPAQFTDIFTSLASGQAPLMVLLQQGGQLKDSFGGAGAAARALGGYVAGMINPVTLLAAAVGATAVGFALGSQEQQRYEAALIQSGNAVGTTTASLARMAAAINALTPGATVGQTAEVLTLIASSGEVSAQSLQRFTKAAIDMERAGGPAATETAKAFAELGKSPLQASLRLTESMRYLSAATAEQIATLERQGRAVEAAQLAQDAYAAALEQRAPQMEARLGLLERAWRDIGDAVRNAGDAIKSIGRTGLDDQLASLNEAIGRAERVQGRDGGGLLGKLLGGDLSGLQAQRDALLEQIRLQARAAEAQGARTRQEEAALQWMKEGQQYLGDRVKLETEILRIRNLGVAAGQSEEQIAERLRSLVAARFGSKGGSDNTARERERELQAEARLLAELSGVTADYATDLQRLNEAYARGRLSYDQFLDATAKLSARQPGMVARARELAKAAEDDAEAKRRQAQEQARYLAGLDASLDAGDRTLAQLRLEVVEMTQGKQARQELEILERERLALTLEQTAAMMELNGADAARQRTMAAQVREEIRLRRQLLEASTAKEVADSNERAARAAADEWKRAADDAGAALANALMQGGKSAWEYVVGMVRAQVLTPIVRYVTAPIAAGVLGALGPGAASAAGSAGVGGGLGLIGAGGLLPGLGAAFGVGASLGLGGFAGAGQALSGAGWLLANGGVGAGLAQGAGALLGALGPGLLGRYFGQQLSGGFNFGGSGNGTVNAGLGLGALFGGPIGAGIGALIGGAVNRAFGRRVADSGIEGTFGAGGFSGQQFIFQEGGTFRSDKTTTQPLSPEALAALNAGSLAALSSARAYADVLKLPAAALDGVTAGIKVSLRGLSEDEVQRRITEAVAGYQEALLGTFRTQLEPLRKLGETFTDTAARLASLQVFSQNLLELGGVFARVANSSVAARENLIEMVGGMDSLASLAQQYAQQYFSRDEIAGIKARDLQSALASVGVTQDLRSRDDFRALVEGTDVSTEAGRRRLAQLLRVSGDFASLSDYLGETGIGLQQAALQAPQSEQLASLFNAGTQEQVTATNQVRDSVDRVGSAIGRLIDLMGRSIGGAGSGGGLGFRDRLAPEVELD